MCVCVSVRVCVHGRGSDRAQGGWCHRQGRGAGLGAALWQDSGLLSASDGPGLSGRSKSVTRLVAAHPSPASAPGDSLGSFLPGVQGEGRACERPSQPLTQRAAPRALGSFGLFSGFCGEAPRVSGKHLKVAHLSPQDMAGHQAEAWSCRGPLRQPVLEVTGRPPLCPPPWGHRTTAIRTPGVALTASDTSELLRVTSGNFQKLLEEQESSFS